MKIRNNRFIANTGWMIGERVYQLGVSLVVGLLTARYLGPSNFGKINYIAAFISFATPICNLGFDEILVKKYRDYPQRHGEIIGTAIVSEVFASICVSFLLAVIVSLLNIGDREKLVIFFLQSLYLLFKSTEAIEYWYQSNLEARYSSVVKMIGYTCMTIYRVFLLATSKSVVWFGFATSLDMIVIAFLYIYLYKRQNNPPLRFSIKLAVELLSESYHFIISGLMVVVYSQIDKIMIQEMIGDEKVGLYAAAHTICALWLFIPLALISSAKPIIFEAKKLDEYKYLRRLKQLYASVFWIGIAAGIFVSLFSSTIMKVLYGNDYIAAGDCLSIGIWYGTFAMLGSARSIWILCEGKNKYIKYMLFIGAIVNVVLNYFWIKVWGINGAALATLVTQIVTSLIAPLLFGETRIHTKIVLEAITLDWIRKR